MTDGFKYQGEELNIFEKATNWKRYFGSVINPYIKGDVLEAGAGIGANLQWLPMEQIHRLTLVEPDSAMCTILENKIKEQKNKDITVINGTIHNIEDKLFDTILYIDVLEHIEHDKQEILKAAALLKPGGYLIILSPAFQTLFTPFDKAIGHFRRYNRKTLTNIIPAEILSTSKLVYIDTIGFFASLTNKLFLRQTYPSAKQVSLWDKYMVPVSRLTDKLFFHSFGKSILGLWQKRND